MVQLSLNYNPEIVIPSLSRNLKKGKLIMSSKNIDKKRIWLASPHMSDEGYEMQYVQEAFDTNWIAPLGPNVNGFEKELAAKVGVNHAAALVSGSAAIH